MLDIRMKKVCVCAGKSKRGEDREVKEKNERKKQYKYECDMT